MKKLKTGLFSDPILSFLLKNFLFFSCLFINKIIFYYSSCFSRTFFIFFVKFLLGISTLCPQPRHLIRISIPIRIICQRFSPHGCGFFIWTTSRKPNSLSITPAPFFEIMLSGFKNLFNGNSALFLHYIIANLKEVYPQFCRRS